MATRAPHPTETCASCKSYFEQLGDRDRDVREWMARAQAAERKAAELDLVVAHLARVDLPTHNEQGHKYTIAGQVAHLVRMANYGWSREE